MPSLCTCPRFTFPITHPSHGHLEHVSAELRRTDRDSFMARDPTLCGFDPTSARSQLRSSPHAAHPAPGTARSPHAHTWTGGAPDTPEPAPAVPMALTQRAPAAPVSPRSPPCRHRGSPPPLPPLTAPHRPSPAAPQPRHCRSPLTCCRALAAGLVAQLHAGEAEDTGAAGFLQGWEGEGEVRGTPSPAAPVPVRSHSRSPVRPPSWHEPHHPLNNRGGVASGRPAAASTNRRRRRSGRGGARPGGGGAVSRGRLEALPGRD